MSKFIYWLLCCMVIAGCTTTESSFSRNETPAGVNAYTPPPANTIKPTLGILEFKDKTGGRDRGKAAADQITTHWVKSGRFRVIERARLQDILQEQNLAGVVRPDEVPPPGQIRGCEYLCLGSVTDFEIKKTGDRKGGGFLRGIGRAVRTPVLDIDFSSEKLDFHIGLDVRIVNTTDGSIVFAESTDVKRTETAKGMGLGLAGFDISTGGKIEVDSENQGRLLRLATDEIVHKMLPQIDRRFAR